MKYPGQEEAEHMCRQARRICPILEGGRRWPGHDEFSHLEHELLVDELEAAGGPPDGAWILPEEFGDDA